MEIKPTQKLEFFLEDPYDDGYIVLPVSYLKKAQKYTDKFLLLPKRIKLDTSDDRGIAFLALAVDRLLKTKSDITLSVVASMLGISVEKVQKSLNLAFERGDITVQDNKLELKWRQKTDLTDEILAEEALTGETKKVIHVIALWHSSFIAEFKHRSTLDEKDRNGARELASVYELNEIEEYFKMYLKSKITWPLDTKKLEFVNTNINRLILEKQREEEVRRSRRIYKPEDYAKELTDEDLKEYLIGKIKNRWSDKEEWTKNYESELVRRNITINQITDEEFAKFDKKFKQ